MVVRIAKMTNMAGQVIILFNIKLYELALLGTSCS